VFGLRLEGDLAKVALNLREIHKLSINSHKIGNTAAALTAKSMHNASKTIQ